MGLFKHFVMAVLVSDMVLQSVQIQPISQMRQAVWLESIAPLWKYFRCCLEVPTKGPVPSEQLPSLQRMGSVIGVCHRSVQTNEEFGLLLATLKVSQSVLKRHCTQAV